MEKAIRDRILQQRLLHDDRVINEKLKEAENPSASDTSANSEATTTSSSTVLTPTTTTNNSNNTSAESEEKGKVTDEELCKEIHELILDGRRLSGVSTLGAQDHSDDEIDRVKHLLSLFQNLKKLTLNQTEIKTLAFLPKIDSVVCLECTDNHISTHLSAIPQAFPNVKKLQLGGNHIKHIDEIQPLKELKNLEVLGLDMNPLSELSEYRADIFKMLPNLKILDFADRKGEEVQQDNETEDDEYEGGNAENYDEDEDNTLRDFYEKDYDSNDDDNDDNDDEFIPDERELSKVVAEDNELDGIEEDEDDDDDEEDQNSNTNDHNDSKSAHTENSVTTTTVNEDINQEMKNATSPSLKKQEAAVEEAEKKRKSYDTENNDEHNTKQQKTE